MKNKTIALMVLGILFLIGIFSMLFSYHNPTTGTVVRENEKLIFGVDTFTMASAPVFVAEAKGFWKEEGLDVEIKPFVSGRLALDGLVGKSVDAATVVDFAAVLAAFQQQKVKIITTFSTSEKHVNLLARKDRGISKPEDLAGKKIAVSSGTSGEYVLNRFLEANNISQLDVKIVNLNPPDMAAAITRGDVDAIITWQPHIYNAKNMLGNNSVLFSSKGLYNHPFNVVVLEESLAAQKEAQKKLLFGLKKAGKFMRENEKESVEITTKRLGMNAKDVEALWDGYSFKINIDPSLVNSLENEGKWAKKAGIVKQETEEPDYKSLVYDGYVKTMK